MGRINPLIAIGIPTWGRVSTQWARAYRHLAGPLGSTMVELDFVEGRPIAEARNTLMQQAIAADCAFLFFLADDVLMPMDGIMRLLQRLWDDPSKDLITGVYWTKTYPTTPYLWRVMQQGPYRDWKLGELFKVDFAGCDALLIRLSDRVKALGPEWFSTNWVWEPGEQPNYLMTEDFYFYTRARKAGIDLWCDSAVQCLHEDRQSGELFGLTNDMPQAGMPPMVLPEAQAGEDGRVVVADIGCGLTEPFFGDPEKVKVIRLDADEKVNPDYRCDIRRLPLPDQSVDLVYANHVLEHFGRAEIMQVIAEWSRILRVGGEFQVGVPNLIDAMRWILKMEEGEAEPHYYPWWQLYGEQRDARDFHKNGFTPKRLQLLLERLGIFEDMTVEEREDGHNLFARAKKVRHLEPLAILPVWDEIGKAEGVTFPGLKPPFDPDSIKTEGIGTGGNGKVSEEALEMLQAVVPVGEVQEEPEEVKHGPL